MAHADPPRRFDAPRPSANAPRDPETTLVSRARTKRSVATLLAIYPATVAIVTLALILVPSQRGAPALVQIFLPHLLLAALPLVPVAAILRQRVLIAALVTLALVGAVRYGSDWVSGPAPATGTADITVLSWNLQVGARAGDDVVAGLRGTSADIVGLQELTPEAAAAIEADEQLVTRFPYRILHPESSVLGLGILSRHPIRDPELFREPVGIEARVELPGGETLAIINAHPLPGRIATGPLRVAVAFDAGRRDADLARVRERVDRLLLAGSPLVVLGDYNVTPTEPAYGRLARGLRDAHAERGLGPGWTWRPTALDDLGVAILRIDYVFTSRTIEIVSVDVDCTRAGDHCLLTARLDLP